LAYIAERRVIPVIGPELLRVTVGDQNDVSLYDFVAGELARRLEVTDQLPAEATLNDVVCKFIEAPRRVISEVYTEIHQIMKEAVIEPPRTLIQLAEIFDFDLFVTTTFDDLLERAINSARFEGRSQTRAIAYCYKGRVEDLPEQGRDAGTPIVFHLLGRLSPLRTYCVSDEDLLEFICALQTKSRRPERLFDELRDNHLLILGASYSDWLARFFLRTAKQSCLSDSRDFFEVVADRRTSADRNLVVFLKHFSTQTRVYHGGDAAAFVDQLWQQWRQLNPPTVRPMIDLPPPREMPASAVFISYTREDLAAARVLKNGLEKAGINAWFDMEQLGAGDTFETKIRGRVQKCSCFMPILSSHTENRPEGWFRREWRFALDRDLAIHENKPFIVPVIVDDTDRLAMVPARFRELHWTRLPGGQVTDEFAQSIAQKFPATLGQGST
jgi:hypothetical protein